VSAVPAAADEELPTRSGIENWPTQHLDDAAARWEAKATTSVETFEQHHRNVVSPGGTEWTGLANEAAVDRVTSDLGVVRHHAEVKTEAAKEARTGGEDIRAVKKLVAEAISEAEQDGFTVSEDLSVTDARKYDIDTVLERNKAAKEHAEFIRFRAAQLVAADKLVGKQLKAKAAELQGIKFQGEDEYSGAHVQLVDNKFKQDPPPADPDKDPWAPHPDFPNRTNNGKYGVGNSKDGEAAAEAAIAERERKTHIPIIRQEVRAIQPDVINPKTGKPQHRYYDGLEPTDEPDVYIGIEAKTNPDALDKKQQNFDDAVSAEHPATAKLNGRPITIVDAQTVYPPDGWVPPPESAALPGAGSTAALPEPPKMWKDDGQPLVPGGQQPVPHAGSDPFPNWGTHISPDELAKSSDPELSNLGKFLQGLNRSDPNNPDNRA
jgi:hypothetical protein